MSKISYRIKLKTQEKNRVHINHNFRFAKLSDLNEIMSFIKKNWDRNHILSNNKTFFKYQFLSEKKKLNFLLAINKRKKIEAIHGFIFYTKKKWRNLCGSIACVDKDSTTPFLGISVMKELFSRLKYKTYLGIGTNPKTMVPLVKNIFNRSVGKMEHYYILNSLKKKFRIAKVNNYPKLKKKFNFNYKLKLIETIDELRKKIDFSKCYKNFPYKNLDYIKKRYFDHPIFNYKIFLILNNKKNSSKSFLVTREINFKSEKILSIIDFIGRESDLSKIGYELRSLIEKKNYEYVDILCANIKKSILLKSGFTYKNFNDKNIIPIYFQPYVKKNVEIWYEISHKNLKIFKGDADQDNPR